MARTAQIKVGLGVYHRDLLEWGAEKLGIPPATYARELLTEVLARLLDDPAVRREWISRPRKTLEDLEREWASVDEDLQVDEIRGALRARSLIR